jgi:hypothetical protein
MYLRAEHRARTPEKHHVAVAATRPVLWISALRVLVVD